MTTTYAFSTTSYALQAFTTFSKLIENIDKYNITY